MLGRTSLSLVACVIVSGTAACRSDSTPPAEAPQTTAGIPERQFTAGDTFGVLRAMHDGEVDRGTLAQRKAIDPRVRSFAAKVVNDHRARMQAEDQLMSGLGTTARESDASNRIKNATERQKSELDAISGTDFDRTYLDDQIDYYRMVLDTMDRELYPNAREPQLRATVQSARERANEHLREAQALRTALSIANPTQ